MYRRRRPLPRLPQFSSFHTPTLYIQYIPTSLPHLPYRLRALCSAKPHLCYTSCSSPPVVARGRVPLWQWRFHERRLVFPHPSPLTSFSGGAHSFLSPCLPCGALILLAVAVCCCCCGVTSTDRLLLGYSIRRCLLWCCSPVHRFQVHIFYVGVGLSNTPSRYTSHGKIIWSLFPGWRQTARDISPIYLVVFIQAC